MVKGKEYTTAKENNNGNSTVDWISLSILPSRIFADSNLDIVKKQEKSVAGYNDQLTKYYVRFKENSEILNHSASIKESFIFHYKQTGNYKGNSTSTDSSVKIDSLKKYTASFSFDNGWKVDVTSKNHEEIGVCLWAYCMWYGALWSYSERSEPLQFYLYDQYGNSANVSVVADGDENLSFSVNLIE
ncbi:hypothetical protein [Photorhabdus thracensis]|nr:hypothetical protein [Photorhabdus thracensis]